MYWIPTPSAHFYAFKHNKLLNCSTFKFRIFEHESESKFTKLRVCLFRVPLHCIQNIGWLCKTKLIKKANWEVTLRALNNV